MTADPVAQNIIVSQSEKLKEPGPSDRIFKDECMFCFKTPFFPRGLSICLNRFVGLCNDHIRSYVQGTGSQLFLNMKYERPDEKEPNEIIYKHTLQVFTDVNTDIERSIEESVVGERLAKIIQAIIDHKSAHLQENFEQGLEWDGTEVFESDVVKNLVQIAVKKEIPPGGWFCEHQGCGLKQNLWLNLSDSFVSCGRQSHGSKYEGRGHAELHASETGYVLVVRVATIENEVGECFQYDFSSKQYSNDRYVKNPFLKKQLAHFGLDIAKFEKTEEHRDVLNQNYNMSEFFAIQEAGSELEAVYGPGFTGLINMGSSCYINSVLQTLLVIPDFPEVYDKRAELIFSSKDATSSHDDFNCQFAKVIHCLNNTDDYSKPESKLNGIKPLQFRRVVGKGHYEFSTTKQQDTEQYVRHLFELIDANVPSDSNPVDALRYISFNRFEDVASTNVRYRKHFDYILPLTVPMNYATQSKDDPERKVISLEACISATFAEETIEGYVSPVTKEAKGAKQSMKMGSFPDFLLIQIKRFAYNAVGEQEKLKIDIEGVDKLNLNACFSEGLQKGEKSLPEDNQPVKPVVDDGIVAMIVSMGYDINAAKRAVAKTNNAGVEAAMNYLLDHFDEIPQEEEKTAPAAVEPNVQVRKGEGKYQLQGFISHIGSSPGSGHYVAHLKKGDKWYIYNDEKVAISKNPPKAMGYLYLYKRE